MKRCRQAIFIVISLSIAGCAGRTAQPAIGVHPTPGAESVRVCLLKDPRSDLPGWASGIPTGTEEIVTCLHVVRTPVSSLSIDDQTVFVEVVAAGGQWHSTNADGTVASGDDWADIASDWLKLKVPGGRFPAPAQNVIDFDRPLRAGETIVLIGFPFNASKAISESPNKPTIVAGRVAKSPSDWNDRIIAVELDVPPDHDHFGGMSGGAAAVYDSRAKQWVVVGIVRGASERRYGFGPFEWSVESLVQIVRPPPRP